MKKKFSKERFYKRFYAQAAANFDPDKWVVPLSLMCVGIKDFSNSISEMREALNKLKSSMSIE